MDTQKFIISKGSTEVFYTLRGLRVGTASFAGFYKDTEEHFHICTLAKDLDVAKAKAKKLTGVECEYDETSLDRKGDWGYDALSGKKRNKVNGNVVEKQEINLDTLTFPFGKYKGQLVLDILESDPKYVVWFKENANGKAASDISNALSVFPAYEDATFAEVNQKVAKFHNTQYYAEVGDVIEMEFEIPNFFDGSVNVVSDNVVVRCVFNDKDVKSYQYNNRWYHMLIVDGKARKLAGQKVKVTAKVWKNEDNFDDRVNPSNIHQIDFNKYSYAKVLTFELV
jgi:hypothetical protein